MIPRVLLPGRSSDRIAAAVREAGGEPVQVPLIRAETRQGPEVESALERLAGGEFDLVVVTSGATAGALRELGAIVPPVTRLLAIGAGTAAALNAAGYPGAILAASPTGEGLLASIAVEGLHILLPQSSLAEPGIADGLRERGHDVVAISVYDTVEVAPPIGLADAVATGEFAAIVVTSGSVARAVHAQLEVPPSTALIALGATARRAAEALGLPVVGFDTLRLLSSVTETEDRV